MSSIAETAADDRPFLAAVLLPAVAAAITYTSTAHRQGITLLTIVGLMTAVGPIVGLVAYYRKMD